MVALVHTLVFLFGGVTGSSERSVLQPSTVAAPVQSIRDWTSANGDRRARATLLRVEGDKVWLRTSEGRLATTTKSAVSQDDRRYLVEHESALAIGNSKSSNNPSLQVLRDLPATAKTKPNSPQRIVPAALVYVRVSRELIEDYVERTVRTRKPVRDCVLGTRIIGESDTVGKTHITLLPSKNSIAGEVGFYGNVYARTTGYIGPAIFQFRSEASFRAFKPIALGESGLSVAPAVALAPTELQTIGVRTMLPGLRGRIATRIATRREASSRSEAEAIIARHSAATIREDFDERIDQSIS